MLALTYLLLFSLLLLAIITLFGTAALGAQLKNHSAIKWRVLVLSVITLTMFFLRAVVFSTTIFEWTGDFPFIAGRDKGDALCFLLLEWLPGAVLLALMRRSKARNDEAKGASNKYGSNGV